MKVVFRGSEREVAFHGNIFRTYICISLEGGDDSGRNENDAKMARDRVDLLFLTLQCTSGPQYAAPVRAA